MARFPWKRILAITLLIITFPLVRPVFAASSDRYVADRFVFLGKFQEKPLVFTIEFDRGFSEKMDNPYVAAFDGHFLFADTWHHLKNGVYIEGKNPFPLELIPEFNPCLVQWLVTQKTQVINNETRITRILEGGAINYDLQEIHFMLQFRNLKMLDAEGNVPGFLVVTGAADAVVQFQGHAIEGKLIYQKMDLTGFNKYAHNFKRMRHRKFQQFFLLGERGDLFIIWREDEANKIPGQWLGANKVIIYEKEANLVNGAPLSPSSNFVYGTPVKIAGKYGYGRPLVKWTSTQKEPNPQNPFREYPTGWKVDFDFTRINKTKGHENEREIIHNLITLSSEPYFYWFYRGMFGAEGVVETKIEDVECDTTSTVSQKAFGLVDVIRGR